MPVSLERRLFAPANARILGVARVGVGIAALMELVSSAGRVLILGSGEVIRLPILEAVGALFLAMPVATLAVWLLAAVAFAIGFATPLAGIVLAAVMFGLVTADAQLYSNHSYLIAIGVALLTVCDAGSSFSLDARRRGSDSRPAPAWTILSLRMQLSVMYLFAVAAKLNPSFLSGSVVAASLRRDGIAFPEAWIGFETMFVMSVTVIAAELFLAIGLWRRRWRPAAFVIGLLLHVGIVATMHAAWDLAAFTVVTLSLYVSFVDAPRGGHAVVWDDACGFCGAWVRWFRRLDWLDTLRFIPRSGLPNSHLPVSDDAAAEAMHVVGPRRTTRAFRAVADVLAVLPISFLWAPLLRNTAITAAGERAYRSIAARRTCPVIPAERTVAIG